MQTFQVGLYNLSKDNKINFKIYKCLNVCTRHRHKGFNNTLNVTVIAL